MSDPSLLPSSSPLSPFSLSLPRPFFVHVGRSGGGGERCPTTASIFSPHVHFELADKMRTFQWAGSTSLPSPPSITVPVSLLSTSRRRKSGGGGSGEGSRSSSAGSGICSARATTDEVEQAERGKDAGEDAWSSACEDEAQ
uniref:Uncharacterized protein n=1 Tax=Oryza sativa subsp. japonica TaxID=39947 RepID=Q6K6Q9_ORYSJ|nr:hypothetical protein [Oryza sativa Japonica Group]